MRGIVASAGHLELKLPTPNSQSNSQLQFPTSSRADWLDDFGWELGVGRGIGSCAPNGALAQRLADHQHQRVAGEKVCSRKGPPRPITKLTDGVVSRSARSLGDLRREVDRDLLHARE